jgi:hypothetical protein
LVKADDRPFAAERASLGQAQRAFLARKLGPSGYTVSNLKPLTNSRTSFDDARAEFMAEQLERCLRFEPTFDAVVGERWNAIGELRLGDAWLHAQWLYQNMPWSQFGHGNIIQAKIAESIKTPSSHGKILGWARHSKPTGLIKWRL